MAVLDSLGAWRAASSPAWHQLPSADAVAALGSDPERGLTQAEADARLSQHGRNELEAEKPKPGWLKFLLQFKDMLVILLLVATGISFGLWLQERESALPYEALAIFSIVLLNALMGYLQEARAEKAVAALKRISASHASVVRDGERRSVPSADVVPGDLLLLEEGNTVPADARLLAVTALQTAEAALTGESEPVAKELDPVAGDVSLGDLRDMVFSGTAVTYGHGRAVVVATGMHTQIGRIASALKHAEVESTPLQRELALLGRRMGLVVIAIALVMMGTIIVVEKVSGASALFDVLIFSNIRKFLRYLLSSNFGEVLTMFFGVVFADVIGLKEAEDGVVVLPLLATQMLWVNLATDGAPALALGLDPADASVMQRPPRSRDESVVTPKMWAGIILTGVVTAVGTLALLDASLPGGLIEGRGELRYAQTRAFTTLVCFSLFTVFTSRSDDRSAFHRLFSNAWLWGAVLLSLALQLAVVYVPFLQTAFGTTALSARDWLTCAAVASLVVWVRELAKLLGRTEKPSPSSPSRQ